MEQWKGSNHVYPSLGIINHNVKRSTYRESSVTLLSGILVFSGKGWAPLSARLNLHEGTTEGATGRRIQLNFLQKEKAKFIHWLNQPFNVRIEATKRGSKFNCGFSR